MNKLLLSELKKYFVLNNILLIFKIGNLHPATFHQDACNAARIAPVLMHDPSQDPDPPRSQSLRHVLVWLVIVVFLILFWLAVGTVVAAWLS